MTRSLEWTEYDPTWLVELARRSRPDLAWLPASLARCTRAAAGGPAYLYFVDPSRPNEPGSEWQIVVNLFLEHPEEGELVLDVLTEDRIGGVEFLSRL